MSEKARSGARSKESMTPPATKGTSVPVACGMEGCDHAAALQFEGNTPYEGFTFDTTGWTVVEDTEDHRTVFLCPDCSKEFEQEAAGEDGLEDEDDDLDDGDSEAA